MTTFSSKRSIVAQVARWAARILATAMLLLFIVLAAGQGLPPLSWLSGALLLIIMGLAVAWLHDLSAGVLIVVGTAAFYLINFAQSGRLPSGWVFPLLFVPGVLLLLSFAMSGRARHIQA